MKRFLVCSVVMAAVLSMGLVLIHCGGGGDDKECENNQDCETLHGTGWWCDRTLWECKELTCVPDCAGKCGGDDGCESTCPNMCPADYECNTDTWICDFTGCTTTADCQQDQCCLQSVCRDKACGVFVCGPDPVCGLDCGTCGAGTHCSAGACVQDVACTSDADCLAGEECCIGTPLTCTPKACGALECGPDPTCGIECGPCVAPQTCSAGQCVTQGSGALGDPCAFGDVNITAGACNAGLECLGIPADGTSAGTCPGGASSECTTLIEEWNPDCVNGNCGASFCSVACGVGHRERLLRRMRGRDGMPGQRRHRILPGRH